MLHFPVWWKINFLKSPPQPLFVLCFNLYIGNHRDYSITQRLFKCECTKNCRIFIISWIASVKLLRKHALEVARNPCITFEPTRSVCRRSLRAAPLEDHLPAAGLPRVLSPKPFEHVFLSPIFMKLERLSYPFPEEQFCSCLRTVCHPQALRNLKNLSTVVFFSNFLPHLFLTFMSGNFYSEPARPAALVFQTWRKNARAGESSGGFSVVQTSPPIWVTQIVPWGRCKKGHLHVPLLGMCDDIMYASMNGIFKI